ncbi:limonene-1,2-epoxide hydrolase family protein [Patulibacter minatonensis]|uniref:limonene-1,2-epoxide hydrolase family protein n=1 Tax=Patulibacter minatonensis TaxID=298163 RepID=UPI000479D4A6|nr:limonene-1,2-epoxide hydrolase family protein [Patulibacter minatonensis]
MSTPDPAPLPSGAAASESPEASVVRAFLASLELLDIERALGYLADDVAYTNVSTPTVHGRENVRSVLKGFLRFATGFEAVNHRIAADGHVVLTERTDAIEIGRLRIQFWVVGRFEVRDGRITVWRDYFDWVNVTAGLVRGLAGVVVPSVRAKVPAGR